MSGHIEPAASRVATADSATLRTIRKSFRISIVFMRMKRNLLCLQQKP